MTEKNSNKESEGQKTLIHLNKKITLFGFNPLVGFLLAIMAIFFLITAIGTGSEVMILIAFIYIPSFIFISSNNMRNARLNKSSFIEVMMMKSKLVLYRDETRIIDLLKREKKI